MQAKQRQSALRPSSRRSSLNTGGEVHSRPPSRLVTALPARALAANPASPSSSLAHLLQQHGKVGVWESMCRSDVLALSHGI